MRGDNGRVRRLVVPIVLVLLGACSGDDATTDASSPEVVAVSDRLAELDDAVRAWDASDDLAAARAAAEAAANLVVGPNGPGYGDRDGDGEIAGASEQGLLPGLDGTPAGVASPLADDECVARDVLAGTTSDPAAAWMQMADVIAAWTPQSNTMPQLASHPMRVVGWATLTLATDSLDDAHEYAGHAALHVAVSQDALTC